MGRFAKAAEGSSGHDGSELFHTAELVAGDGTVSQLVQEQLDVEVSLSAGSTLTTAFMDEEILGLTEKLQHGGSLVHYEDGAGAHRDPGGLQVVIGIRSIQDPFIADFAAGAAKLDQADPAAVLHATGEAEDNVPDRGAEGDLEHAGIIHVSGHGNQLGADGLAAAEAAVITLIVQQEVGNDGKAFHIVDGGGQGKEAANLHKGRLHPGTASLAFDRTDEGGAFAADIGPGSGVQMKVEGEVSTEDIVPQQIFFHRFINGVLKMPAEVAILLPEVDVAVLSVHHVTADGHPFNDVEGIVPDELPVLKGTGLSFIGVADNDLFGFFYSPGLGPFFAHIVGGAAPAFNLYIGNEGGNILPVHGQGLFQSLIAADAQIRVQGQGIIAAEVLRDEAGRRCFI